MEEFTQKPDEGLSKLERQAQAKISKFLPMSYPAFNTQMGLYEKWE